MLDKLPQQTSARRQIGRTCSTKQELGKSEVGHPVENREKLYVYSLLSLEPKHTHSSGKPEWKPASSFQPFLAREILPPNTGLH